MHVLRMEFPVGIIPARAGFTVLSESSRRRVADHPRSRGVYRIKYGFIMETAGSSPLARGLLTALQGELEGRRIIPARAGFTTLTP